MLAEWGRVWVALPWGGGAVGETVNKIKYKGERDIPVSVEHGAQAGEGSICTTWLSQLKPIG